MPDDIEAKPSMKPCSFAAAECNFNETLETLETDSTDSFILLTAHHASLASEMYDPYKAFQESYAEVESNKLNDIIKGITVTIASLITYVGLVIPLLVGFRTSFGFRKLLQLSG